MRPIGEYLHMFQKTKGGVVMVNFYSLYITCPPSTDTIATLKHVAGTYNCYCMGTLSFVPPTHTQVK